jgi:hypothetical protein
MNSFNKNIQIYIAGVAATLVAIWPLPDTIAFRQMLLIAGVTMSLLVISRNGRPILKKEAWPLWMLASFFLWLLVHLAFFSVRVTEQVHELRSDWVRSLLAAILGLGLGIVLQNPGEEDQQSTFGKLELILFAGFAGTIVIFFVRYLYEIWATSQWLHLDFFMTPYKSKTPIVIFGGIFLPLAFITILKVISGAEKTQWATLSVLGILLTLFADYFANTKNGIAVFVFASLIFFFKLIKSIKATHYHRRLVWSCITATLLIASFGIKKHVETNPAWTMIWSDFKVGIDIEHHDGWKDIGRFPVPMNEHGLSVNTSTYLRAAWATAGLQLVKENPQGYGLINHSFGALAIEKWTDFSPPNGKTKGATHSGWLDFTLGLGIPGLILVLIPLWASFRRALYIPGFWFNYVVWAVPIITFAYTITEVSSDHFIELLFFMTAFVCGLTITGSPHPRRVGYPQ